MKHWRLPEIMAASIMAMLLVSCAGDGTPAYKDASLSPEKRVEDLIKRMTVEEKIGQLLCPLGWPMYEKTSDTTVTWSQEYVKFMKEQHGGQLWAVFRADPWTRKTLENGLNPVLAAKAYNALQHYAMDSTRLGIPIIFAEEAPHGHMAIGTTVFPTSISLAATWDPELLEQVGGVIAQELRAQGGHIAYGPVIDLARELRWSRVEETWGEDVYLTTEMARGMVRGTSPKHNGWDKGVISTLKHFVAYGIPEGGHNGNPSNVGERDLWENFLPAFRDIIEEGALSVMTSYNSIDGVPSTSNTKLLTGVLHDMWGFEGFTVSDLVSIDGLCNDHHIASSLQEAGEMAINAGVDVDLGANCYSLLKESVEQGRVSMEVLDRAVRHALLVKFRLDLFDNPYIDPQEAAQKVRNAENVAIARQAAREGVVLLENNGILPLGRDMKIAVIGPNANSTYNQLGDYTAPQPDDNVVTPLEGIQAAARNVSYVKGCAIRDMDASQIAQAAAAARAADVAVVVVGGSSARDFKTKYKDTGAAIADETVVSDMEAGEGFDRSSLELLGRQNELLEAVKKTGTPMVVVYIEGRPLDMRWAKDNADALLTQFYPGQEGGNGLADVLFGDFNPAGRLPVSVPRDAGQLPVYYNKKFPQGHDYVEESASPLYAFGYGLSYTSFSYDSMEVIRTGDASAQAMVTITNTGSRDGDEVVQIYVTDPVASTVRPRLQLRGFKRVHVKAGESVQLSFTLGEDAFSIIDGNMERVVEKGDFIIKAGPSSDNILLEETIAL